MTTAIFDTTHQCLEVFNHIVAKHGESGESILTRLVMPNNDSSGGKRKGQSPRDFLGLRNSFSFWIDYTGALSLMDSSLDVRLQGLVDISSMVIELLEMVLRNLHRLDRNAEDTSTHSADSTWEDASQAISSALDRLHFISVAIRKASARKLEYNVATFLTEDDIVFRRDAAALVRFRFPAARKSLCQQLGDSIAVRRRILLQKHRHARKLAVRRVVESGTPAKQDSNHEASIEPITDHSPRVKMLRNAKVLGSGVTKASRPDPKSPALRHLYAPKPALTTLISTISTTQQDPFEYPSPPKASEGETRVQCPYCLMALDCAELENKDNKFWTRHIDEDITPYTCLFPECANALVFFPRRSEWKMHMKSAHPEDWTRRIHATTWYCDIDHEPPERFETDLQWRSHMRNVDSHPNRHLRKPSEAQLDALSSNKQLVALRDRFVCPLCEQIPDKIRPLVQKEKGNKAEWEEQLVEHIASHIKSLSLLSLPCLDNKSAPPGSDGESVAINDSFNRLMNLGSIPRPPSGVELLEGVPTPPEAWSTLNREDLASLVSPSSESPWDKEFPNFIHPEDPPDMLDDTWVEDWKIWKKERSPFDQQPIELDPILACLQEAKIAAVPAIISDSSDDTSVYDSSDDDANDTSDQSLLRAAVRSGDEVSVKKLLDNGLPTDDPDKRGRTLLSWAAEKGRETVVKLLLETGKAEIDSKDNNNRTPLSWAAENGHETVVKLFLNAGAFIDAADQDNRTSLSRAAEKGRETVVKLLLETGKAEIDSKDNNNRTPLLWAAENGHETVVKLLLETGKAEINSKDVEYGQTPLSWAAENGHETVVKLLLETGKAEIDPEDNNNRTPLLWAAENGHETVVKLLLDAGASVDAVDQYNRTSLSRAAEKGRETVVKLLLETGKAEIDSKNYNGQTPLSWAAENGHETVVKLLLDAGASVDAADTNSRTPLSWAAGNGREAAIKLLLDAGASVDAADKNNRTLLSWAAEKGRETVVKLLLDAGASVDAASTSNRTPLSFAAENGQNDIVQLLIDRGARVNNADDDGCTPLDWAEMRGHDAVKLFMDGYNDRRL